jgi:putative transposase
MSRYEHGAYTTHRLKYHLVWIPKYRKRVLQGPLARRLYELLRECSDVNDWPINEMNVQTDHAHMLVQLPPNVFVKSFRNWRNSSVERVYGPSASLPNQWVRLRKAE